MKNATLEEIGSKAGMIINIDRDEVEAANLETFLGFLGHYDITDPGNVEPQLLANLQSKIILTIDGYENDPRELFEVPEVCRYFQLIHEAWPYGLYFFNQQPAFATLQLLIWCNSGAKKARNGGNGIITVQVNADKFKAFIHSAMIPFFSIAGQLGWPPEKVSGRMQEIIGQFEAISEGSPAPESDDERRQRHHEFIRSNRENLAMVARNGYQEEGRGFVMILPPEPGRNGFGAMYINQAGLQAAGQVTQIGGMVERYDPATQFIVSLLEPNSSSNCSSSYTVKLP